MRTAFEFTCAVLADASLWCWGYNKEGQLGLGDEYPGDDRLAPVQLGTAHDWTFVATGQGHGCGIRAPGRLSAGDVTPTRSSARAPPIRRRFGRPVQVGTDEDWVEVGCGQSITCGRKRDGTLWCWGAMASGALAVGDVTPRPSPARVPTFADWSALTVQTFHTCGLRPGGELWCAGRNTEGQTGASTLVDVQPSMLRADATGGWTEVRAGRFFTCARKADESIWCMGTNTARELGVDPSVMDRSAVLVRIPLP